ncbi:MAG: hypothetical protein O3C40_25700 [Planctomycetota bacterium]|nr:hypothetical protein [Planctomycetota bacterium]
MSTYPDDLAQRASDYAAFRNTSVRFDRQLGFGNDGQVWQSHRKSAIKVFERFGNYNREVACYQRLRDLNIDEVGNLSVPRLVDFDEELLVVEMTIVTPPFLLDFGKAYLDQPPDYSAEVLEDWERERVELFGDRWSEVREALSWLRSIGIYYYDAKPGNITFADE